MEASGIQYGEKTAKHQNPKRGIGQNQDNNLDFAAGFSAGVRLRSLEKRQGSI